MEKLIELDDKRYTRAVNQGFLCQKLTGTTFGNIKEGEEFIGTYCSRCRLEKTCDTNYELQSAMKGNYPFSSPELVRLNLRFQPWDNDSQLFPKTVAPYDPKERPETVITCTSFKSKQLRFEFE